MPRFLQDMIAVTVYLLFGAVEIVVVWGALLLMFGTPIGIAWLLGARGGDELMIGSLVLGLVLAFIWYSFLDNGGKRRIEAWFRQLTHRVICKLGAQDAIHD